MAKKADRPVVFTGGAGQYPNPAYFGLKGKFWNRIQKHVDEIQDIQERTRKVNARRAELEQELQYQKREHEKALVYAARVGKDEPNDSALRLTERAVAKQVERAETLRKALQAVERDLQVVLREGTSPEILEELRERGRKHEERYQALVAEAMQGRDKLGEAYALHMFARGEDERGTPVPERNHFRLPPLSPAPDSSAWYEHRLNWGDREYQDTPITVAASYY
jgi:hypothetical protein